MTIPFLLFMNSDISIKTCLKLRFTSGGMCESVSDPKSHKC